MRRRGITLIELMLAVVVSMLVMIAAGNAYILGVRTNNTIGQGRDEVARQADFEAKLTDLFNHIYIDPDATNTNTFFVSGDAVTSPSASTNGSSSSSDANSLVFTVVGRRLPSSLLNSTDDFETNNEKFGPVGGVTEVQLGMTPVGTDPSGEPGLYLREQTPSDADPSQGGMESKLSSYVQSISFEYYDGTAWQTTWDTTTMGTRRLPSAIRVTFRLTDDTQDRILVFAVPSSDVTPDNPVQQETAS